MGEESHLDEMRSAIRGDFERLANRRGEQELLRVPESAGADAETSSPSDAPESPRRSWLARLLAPP